METKNFLTYEEAKEGADYCFWHSEGVYEYKKDGKCTLIEKGKILVEVEGVDCCNWYSEGVYKYQKDGKWTKINKKENNGN